MNLKEAFARLGPNPNDENEPFPAEGLEAIPRSAIKRGVRMVEAAADIMSKGLDSIAERTAHEKQEASLSYLRASAAILHAAYLLTDEKAPIEFDDVPMPAYTGDHATDNELRHQFGQAVLVSAFTKVAEGGGGLPNDAGTLVGGLGARVDPSKPTEPGQYHRVLALTDRDMIRIGDPVLDILNQMRQGGEDPHIMLAAMLFLMGQLLAQERVTLDENATVKAALAPLLRGYESCQQAMRDAGH